MPKQFFIESDKYFTAYEPILEAYLQLTPTSLWICVFILSLIGNGSVNTFPEKEYEQYYENCYIHVSVIAELASLHTRTTSS
jgi:hypothetical protein